MTMDRRDVLRAALALPLLSACGASASKPTTSPPKQLRILILGGSGFLGPKIIDAAIARGHSITTFNRGRREKIQPLSQPIERLYGNRDPDKPAEDDKPSPKGLEQLVGHQWDTVIDDSGYFPRHVDASAQLLAKAAQRYIYISSISAYASMATGGDETAKLAELADPRTEDMGKQFENYGGLKAACERAAQKVFGDRSVIVRPGYIVGPGDPTDRFTYWPVRIAKGGDVLAPGSPDDPLQWIDVRDLAAWLVLLAETGTTGTFNALGPAGRPARWGDVLDTCVRDSKSNAKLVWVPQSFLAAHGGGGEDLFPIWAPPIGETAGAHRWSNARAVAAGLTFHSIDETVRALLEWFPHELDRRAETTQKLLADAQAKGEPAPKLADPTVLRAGPTAEQEQQLLAQFHAP
jgi:2'-hydroxyisoflavone reductase